MTDTTTTSTTDTTNAPAGEPCPVAMRAAMSAARVILEHADELAHYRARTARLAELVAEVLAVGAELAADARERGTAEALEALRTATAAAWQPDAEPRR